MSYSIAQWKPDRNWIWIIWFIILNRSFAWEVVRQLTRKQPYQPVLLPVQQFFHIGMIYIFTPIPHREFIMRYKATVRIERWSLNIIWVIMDHHHNIITFKCFSSRIRQGSFNWSTLKQVMEVLVVPLVFKVGIKLYMCACIDKSLISRF